MEKRAILTVLSMSLIGKFLTYIQEVDSFLAVSLRCKFPDMACHQSPPPACVWLCLYLGQSSRSPSFHINFPCHRPLVTLHWREGGQTLLFPPPGCETLAKRLQIVRAKNIALAPLPPQTFRERERGPSITREL